MDPALCPRSLPTVVWLLAAVAALVAGCGVGSPGDGLVRVERVIDGDTIVIAGGERVRYIGIDTPETAQGSQPETCWAREATALNLDLVADRRVRLERDVSDRDRFGRLLRYVYVDGRDVGGLLIDAGAARAVRYTPDVRQHVEYTGRERSAKTEGRGLWGACERFGAPLGAAR